MERRRALVVAGTMTATLAMAGTAMAVNMGLLGSDSDSVGNLTATEIQPTAQREARPTAAQRTPRVRVVVQDIPVAAGGGTAGGGSYTGTVESGGGDYTPAPTAAPAPNPTAPYVDDDDDDSSYDDDGGGDHGDDDGAEDPSDDGVDEPDDD